VNADALAALLCDWCLEVAPAQQVLIASTTLAEPLILALHAAVLDRGAWPLVRVSPPGLGEQFYRVASDPQLDGFPPLELVEMQQADAYVRIDAPQNTRALAAVDPALVTRAARARRPIQEARLAGRWCVTLWPTEALAQEAAMSLHDYTAFLARALFVDRPDPVAEWRALSDRQAALVERLSTAKQVRIEADGTDLTLSARDAVGSTRTAGGTCRAARCSRGPASGRPTASSASPFPPDRAESRLRASS
jgi:aminopeptidase